MKRVFNPLLVVVLFAFCCSLCVHAACPDPLDPQIPLSIQKVEPAHFYSAIPTTVTITGCFPTIVDSPLDIGNYSVDLAGQPCVITAATLTQITCTSADVKAASGQVTVSAIDLKSGNKRPFDTSLRNSITILTPRALSVFPASIPALANQAFMVYYEDIPVIADIVQFRLVSSTDAVPHIDLVVVHFVQTEPAPTSLTLALPATLPKDIDVDVVYSLQFIGANDKVLNTSPNVIVLTAAVVDEKLQLRSVSPLWIPQSRDLYDESPLRAVTLSGFEMDTVLEIFLHDERDLYQPFLINSTFFTSQTKTELTFTLPSFVQLRISERQTTAHVTTPTLGEHSHVLPLTHDSALFDAAFMLVSLRAQNTLLNTLTRFYLAPPMRDFISYPLAGASSSSSTTTTTTTKNKTSQLIPSQTFPTKTEAPILLSFSWQPFESFPSLPFPVILQLKGLNTWTYQPLESLRGVNDLGENRFTIKGTSVYFYASFALEAATEAELCFTSPPFSVVAADAFDQSCLVYIDTMRLVTDTSVNSVQFSRIITQSNLYDDDFKALNHTQIVTYANSAFLDDPYALIEIHGYNWSQYLSNSTAYDVLLVHSSRSKIEANHPVENYIRIPWARDQFDANVLRGYIPADQCVHHFDSADRTFHGTCKEGKYYPIIARRVYSTSAEGQISVLLKYEAVTVITSTTPQIDLNYSPQPNIRFSLSLLVEYSQTVHDQFLWVLNTYFPSHKFIISPATSQNQSKVFSINVIARPQHCMAPSSSTNSSAKQSCAKSNSEFETLFTTALSNTKSFMSSHVGHYLVQSTATQYTLREDVVYCTSTGAFEVGLKCPSSYQVYVIAISIGAIIILASIFLFITLRTPDDKKAESSEPLIN
jgi:hypothetical protein